MLGALPGIDSFSFRYAEHQVLALLHILPGLLFLVLAPLQFIPRIRQRHIRFHRMNGRVLASMAFVSGVFALVAAFRLPAFGGWITQSATVVFGLIFLFSICMAVINVRNKRIIQHREWMIRVFALGLGVATIRLVIVLAQVVTGYSFEEVFGYSFWIGLSVNFLVAEWWIRMTRP